MEAEQAGKVQVSGVISGLSFGAVFTFSRRRLLTLHRLHITGINTRFPQRSGGSCASQSSQRLKSVQLQSAFVDPGGCGSSASCIKKGDADSFVWAAEIVFK